MPIFSTLLMVSYNDNVGHKKTNLINWVTLQL
jgi:hypothetical protein